MSTNYYAYADKFELENTNVFFEFHCLPFLAENDWPSQQLRQFQANTLERQLPSILLDTSRQQLGEIFKYWENAGDLESGWFLLTSDDRQPGLPANLFLDENDAGAAIYVSLIEPLPEETATKLDELTAISGENDAPEDIIKSALERNTQEDGEFVAVYNVGQGNSNAVCNDRSMPLLYFDLGGGCYKNKSSYPVALRFCFTKNPAIILSHWDTDHYESAKRDKSLQTKTWIVPRQKFGPVHNKFFLQLKAAGTVLVWPPALPSLSFYFGKLVLCNHPNPGKKNHSGLAFVASLATHTNNIREVLLPADAAYTYIPGYSTHTCEGLIATHHGAEFDLLNSPVPTSSGASAIAYSYGNPNSYAHPRAAAISAHLHTNRCDSPKGNIALQDCPPCVLGCGGAGCDLQIVQTY